MSGSETDSEADRGLALRTRLEKLGDARKFNEWETGEVDYVTTLELTADDVPVLLPIVREWAEPQNWQEDKIASYAPVHAWRCLAQLRAAEAIPLLLDMMKALAEVHDNWYLEEFPRAFAWIGPACMQALADYLADQSNLKYPRVTASSGLKELAIRHPETRQDVIDAICRTLSEFEHDDPEINAFVIADLLDLEATEAAELIERAYAADCVALGIVGSWNSARKELGVEGLGLVPKELAGPTLYMRPGVHDSDEDVPDAAAPAPSSPKVGRNEPCPCGSGKKYKKCCGQ